MSENIKKSVIYTDSLSLLTALHFRNATEPLVGNIIHNIEKVTTHGHTIKVFWVPSHIGISGNERADACAALAWSREIKQVTIPHKDCMKLIYRKLKENWQKTWDNELNNKLHLVKPILGEWKSCRHQERYIEVILCRLRIGHTHLTHSFLLTKQEKPLCERCGHDLTVIHILVSCTKLEKLRKKYFTAFYDEHIPFYPALILSESALVNVSCVLNFLREAGVLQKL